MQLRQGRREIDVGARILDLDIGAIDVGDQRLSITAVPELSTGSGQHADQPEESARQSEHQEKGASPDPQPVMHIRVAHGSVASAPQFEQILEEVGMRQQTVDDQRAEDGAQGSGNQQSPGFRQQQVVMQFQQHLGPVCGRRRCQRAVGMDISFDAVSGKMHPRQVRRREHHEQLVRQGFELLQESIDAALDLGTTVTAVLGDIRLFPALETFKEYSECAAQTDQVQQRRGGQARDRVRRAQALEQDRARHRDHRPIPSNAAPPISPVPDSQQATGQTRRASSAQRSSTDHSSGSKNAANTQRLAGSPGSQRAASRQTTRLTKSASGPETKSLWPPCSQSATDQQCI